MSTAFGVTSSSACLSCVEQEHRVMEAEPHQEWIIWQRIHFIQIITDQGRRNYQCVFVCTCSMICRMVFRRTTPEDLSEPASFGSVSNREKHWEVIYTPFKAKTHEWQTWRERDSLAITKRSGISVASLSFAASAIGPNRTTGRRKPAAIIQIVCYNAAYRSSFVTKPYTWE